MNHSYRSIYNVRSGTWVAAPETAKGRGKGSFKARRAAGLLAAALALTAPAASALDANALPTGGQVSAGSGGITVGSNTLTVSQTSQNLALNWQSFNIGSAAAVNFVQPNSSAIALNRVIGSGKSEIYGKLNANGQVFLLNPNGVLFGKNAEVNVGGLVASTLGLSDADFLNRNFRFAGTAGSVVNEGSLSGNYVALLGGQVSNQGTITARLGTVALAAGSDIRLDFAGDGLIGVAVNQGTLDALAENRQLIRADGGTVLLTAKAADHLIQAVVNNEGVIEARTVENRGGVIKLLGDMDNGLAKVGGRLDASAPDGSDGGFVETSAAKVGVGETARVTTLAARGRNGTWLIDPSDYTIAASGGNISGATLSANLGLGNVAILSSSGTAGGNGDINVNDAVAWSANSLTLTAARDININAVMTASGTSTLTLNAGTANGADAGVAGGAVRVGFAPGEANGFAGRVDFPGRSGAGFLTINGQGYAVINSLGAEGSVTGTDLQGISGNLSGKYALGGNIDASATAGWEGGRGFLQLGEYGNAGTIFTGVFDGLGHTITGLTINRQGGGFDENYVGLFGNAEGATIRNVGLTGGSVTGTIYVGALVGRLDEFSTLNNVYNTSSVSAGGYYVGGLVGRSRGVVSDAYNTGNVSGSADVGGLVGGTSAGSAIRDSYNTGGVAGQTNIGGLVGSSSIDTTVSNSHYSIDSVAIEIDSTLQTGFVSRGGLYAAQYASWIAAGRRLDIADWLTLSSSSYLVGSYAGMQSLLGFAEQGYNFKLTTNIALQSGYHIPVLKGVFNGDGKQITGLDLNQPGQSYQGLFGMIASGSSVASLRVGNGYVYGREYVGGLAGYNLGVIDRSSYSGTVESGGDYYNYSLGGLVGWNDGTVSNSRNTGSVIGGYGQIGGLVGRNYTSGIVSASYNSGDITNNGDSAIGGVVGSNDGTIVSAYNTGNINTTTTWGAVGGVVGYLNGGNLGNSYSSGNVTAAAGAATGGLVGLNGGGTVTDSFWNTDTSGQAVSDGGAGKTSAQMKQLATFAGAGWNIDDTGGSGAVWRIYDGYTAPLLRSFLAPLTVTATSGSRVYDGTTSSSLGVSYSSTPNANLLGTASVTAAGKNVGSQTLTAGGLYSNQQGYDIAYVDGTLTITPASLTLSGASAGNKTYDGTTVAAVGGILNGVIGGDSVSLSGAFDTRHVGSGKTVTFGPSGTDAGNYTLVAATTADITPASLTLSGASAGNKTYDGTTVAAVGGILNGVIGGDSVSLSGAFDTRHVGSGKTVTFGLSGADGGNYTLVAATTADVTPASLTVTAADAAKTYDDTAYSGGNGVSYAGFVNGETVAVLGGALTFGGSSQGAVNAGLYAITPGGLTGTNYVLSFIDGILIIRPAPGDNGNGGNSDGYSTALAAAQSQATTEARKEAPPLVEDDGAGTRGAVRNVVTTVVKPGIRLPDGLTE